MQSVACGSRRTENQRPEAGFRDWVARGPVCRNGGAFSSSLRICQGHTQDSGCPKLSQADKTKILPEYDLEAQTPQTRSRRSSLGQQMQVPREAGQPGGTPQSRDAHCTRAWGLAWGGEVRTFTDKLRGTQKGTVQELMSGCPAASCRVVTVELKYTVACNSGGGRVHRLVFQAWCHPPPDMAGPCRHVQL